MGCTRVAGKRKGKRQPKYALFTKNGTQALVRYKDDGDLMVKMFQSHVTLPMVKRVRPEDLKLIKSMLKAGKAVV